MLREWTDKLPSDHADEIWREQRRREVSRRVAVIETDLRNGIDAGDIAPTGFYEAMRHFITLRTTLFPTLPVDLAWNILVTLASTPEGSARSCVTSIAYGAGVPLATALRYIAMMELDGVVQRTPDPSDKRRSIIELTADGRRRLEAVAERWKMRALAALVILPIAVVWLLRLGGVA